MTGRVRARCSSSIRSLVISVRSCGFIFAAASRNCGLDLVGDGSGWNASPTPASTSRRGARPRSSRSAGSGPRRPRRRRALGELLEDGVLVVLRAPLRHVSAPDRVRIPVNTIVSAVGSLMLPAGSCPSGPRSGAADPLALGVEDGGHEVSPGEFLAGPFEQRPVRWARRRA